MLNFESYTCRVFRTQNRISDILQRSPRGFWGPRKTCRTRVEPRSVGLVLHSLENLRRKRAQLERIAGDFTVDTHSLSDTRRGDAKAQVACLRQLALTYCSPDNNGLLVREFSEWWT